MSEVLVEVRRGHHVESVHRGSIAVVNTRGEILAAAGDPDCYTFMRSSAKPIQALAVVESGAYEAFGLSQRELAIMCASHSSEAYHVETVRGILAKLGLDESHLACGTHFPTHAPSAHALLREGRKPTAVHSNCSGKHSGMLALAKHMGWRLDDYWREDHPVQKLCLENIAAVSTYPLSKIGVAKDGCGVSVFALPLCYMAKAFARLASPDDPAFRFPPARVKAAILVAQAMRAHPEMVGGTDRFCTALMRAAPVVAKGGAEGVYCFGVPGRGIGCALKIDDGGSRATYPAAIRVIEHLGLLTPEGAVALESFRRPTNTNNRGDVIGVTEAILSLHP